MTKINKKDFINALKQMSDSYDTYKKYKINKKKDFTDENTFLIKGNLNDIIGYLSKNGFTKWSDKGYYNECNWVYVDLQTKIFAPGIPGIKITNVVFNHSITLNEFINIYEIYLSHEKEYNERGQLSEKKRILTKT